MTQNSTQRAYLSRSSSSISDDYINLNMNVWCTVPDGNNDDVHENLEGLCTVVEGRSTAAWRGREQGRCNYHTLGREGLHNYLYQVWGQHGPGRVKTAPDNKYILKYRKHASFV